MVMTKGEVPLKDPEGPRGGFDINFLIYRCLMKELQVKLWDSAAKTNQKVDVLSVFHRFDTEPLLLTLPFIFDDLDLDFSKHSESQQDMLRALKRSCDFELLQEVKRKIASNAQFVPDASSISAVCAQGGIC